MKNITLNLGNYTIDCFINCNAVYIEITNPKTCEFYEFNSKDSELINDIILNDEIAVFYRLLPQRFMEEFPNLSTSISFVKSNLYFFVTSTPKFTKISVKNLTNLSSKTLLFYGPELFIKTYNGDDSYLYNIFVANVFIESFLLHYLHCYSDKNTPQVVKDYYFKNTAHKYYTSKISKKIYSKITSPDKFIKSLKKINNLSSNVTSLLHLVS